MISTLHIDRMHTVHCVRAVYTALAGVAGIDRAEVSMGRARVEHAVPLDEAALALAIAEVGYALVAVTRERRLPLHEGDDPASA